MKKILGLCLVAIAMTSCSDDNENIKDTPTKAKFIENYANIAAANYDDAYTTAATMKTKIDAFLTTPTEETHKAAQNAWLYARDFYGQTEAFRAANGPIDNEDTGSIDGILNTEGRINAWPLDEGFIDYVSDKKGGSVQNGLIGDVTFDLTEANIIGKNEFNNLADNVATGWHAIEFLLWGQDLNYNPTTHMQDNYAVAGKRGYTDYTTADFAERRKQYLQIVTDLLVNDLKDLKNTWADGGLYRTAFAKLNEATALKNILNGVGFISNGEIALERIIPAVEEGQENEHSCFSDNTNQDMWANVNGINNVIIGAYKRADGTKISGVSLTAITKTLNVEISNNLETKAQTTLNKLDALLALNKSFDEIISQETLTSNGPAIQLSNALKAQGVAIAEVATTLGVSITID
ncbi:imelysin family protein [Tenacibaculum ovolyticum]|uniref:imelysin family protein n=1 Tax=Tenacibaculum ovolyticum TaxID=104270 RepID=UPI003BAB3A9F